MFREIFLYGRPAVQVDFSISDMGTTTTCAPIFRPIIDIFIFRSGGVAAISALYLLWSGVRFVAGSRLSTRLLESTSRLDSQKVIIYGAGFGRSPTLCYRA